MLTGNCLKRHCNLSQVRHTIPLVQGSSIASLEWVCWREKEEKREREPEEKGEEEGVCG